MASSVGDRDKRRDPKGRIVTSDDVDQAIKLFPELKELRRLYGKIDGIENRRRALLLAEARKEYSDAMEQEIELTEILLSEISRFQLRRVSDADSIKASIHDALAAIDDIEEGKKRARSEAEASMISRGVTIPPPSPRMDWEKDTDTGCIVPRMMMNLMKLTIFLHGLVQKWKLDFTINAELKGNELTTFIRANEKDQEMRLSRLVLPEAMKLLNDYMWKAVEAKENSKANSSNKKEREENETIVTDTERRSVRSEWGTDSINDIFLGSESESSLWSPNKEDWSGTQKITCLTCGEKGHAAKYCRAADVPPETGVQYVGDVKVDGGVMPKSNMWEMKDTYCTNCGRHGHNDDYCNLLYPEEEKANFCEHCKREGHMEETCWRLHPGLKAKFLAKQKERQKKVKCHECGS
ncbi:hypothetical protein EG329_001479 [Mollisiaceae sp. DMI_Dod_QoI]|nr:hypothetical protein EG329_001479 [Helotiales sp. DMI_Dod_QoI]